MKALKSPIPNWPIRASSLFRASSGEGVDPRPRDQTRDPDPQRAEVKLSLRSSESNTVVAEAQGVRRGVLLDVDSFPIPKLLAAPAHDRIVTILNQLANRRFGPAVKRGAQDVDDAADIYLERNPSFPRRHRDPRSFCQAGLVSVRVNSCRNQVARPRSTSGGDDSPGVSRKCHEV
jgi:hypothetical protein